MKQKTFVNLMWNENELIPHNHKGNAKIENDFWEGYLWNMQDVLY